MGSSGAEWEDLQSMMNDWARAGVAPVAISVTDAMTIRALRMVGNGEHRWDVWHDRLPGGHPADLAHPGKGITASCSIRYRVST
jgi:hypothetical protein